MAYSEEIQKLVEQGAKDMAAKEYEKAVDHYSEACQLSNLEAGTDDPDLLYLYGWALYENAVANSDVLGQGAAKSTLEADAAAAAADDAEEDDAEGGGGMMQFSEKVAEGEEIEQLDSPEATGAAAVDAEVGDDGEATDEAIANALAAVDAPDERTAAEVEQEVAEEAPEQSDFEIAWDILDLTRSLLQKKLELTDKEESTEKTTEDISKKIKKKLADVYSLLGDISLETENFAQAGQDLGSMVDLRKQLYPEASGALTEAFYRLSLALEFTDLPASIGAQRLALKTISAREKEGEKIDPDIIQEMKQRLYDLEKGDAEVKAQKKQIMEGIIGKSSSTGSSTEAAPVAAVNDLSGMVKKRKAPKKAPKPSKKAKPAEPAK